MMFVKLIEAELKMKVIPEYQFCKTRKFKADYFIPELNLLIEKEGGIYTGQAHGSVTGILRDIEKYNLATTHGFRILRYPPDKLFSLQTIKDIKAIQGLNFNRSEIPNT